MVQMLNKIDPYGIKNVNFSLIEKDDDCWEEYKAQRIENGFDESELWSLDYTIARFICPRLKQFSEDVISYPTGMTCEEWEDKLKQMVKAFEIIVDDNNWELDKEQVDVVNNGLDLFREHFFSLWN